MNKQRDYLMDNIKALLLFLVAFGHTLDVYKGDGGTELYLMKYIYLFHMPMFAFITGYFTKDLDKARNNAVQKSLIPYIIFQGVYVLMATLMISVGLATFNSDTFSNSLIIPSSAFYYLLAVFFWKVFAKDIMCLKHPLIITMLMGLIISVTRMKEFHVGYGAVLTLLPFFVLGMLCDANIIQKIKSIPTVIALLILLAGIIPATYLPYEIHSIRMTYSSVGFSNVQGILYRIVFYLIAVIMGIAIIRLMSVKETKFSYIGRASILVYAGSTFLAPHAYIILDNLFAFSQNRVINMIGMVVFCIVVVLICSLPIFLKWYNAIINGINILIFKRMDDK